MCHLASATTWAGFSLGKLGVERVGDERPSPEAGGVTLWRPPSAVRSPVPSDSRMGTGLHSEFLQCIGLFNSGSSLWLCLTGR